jgi:class 3 adenylate cyclase/PAS domain-containing protein
VDYAFVSFMNLYPRFLLDQVVDRMGESAGLGDAVVMMARDEEAVDLEPPRSLIKDANLRFVLEDASKEMAFAPLTALKCVTFTQIGLVVTFCVVMLIAGPSIMGGVDELFTDQEYANSCYNNLTRLMACQGLLLGNDSGAFPAEEWFERVGVGVEVWSQFRNYPNKTSWIAISAISARVELSRLMVIQASGGKDVRRFLGMLNEDIYTVVEVPSLEQRHWPGRMLLAAMLDSSVASVTTDLHGTGNDELMGALVSLVGCFMKFEAGKAALAEDGLDLIAADSSVFEVLEIAAPVVLGVIFLPLQLGTLVWFFKRINSAIRTLAATRQEVVERSTSPIQANVTLLKITGGAQQVPPALDPMKVVLPVLVALVLLADCAGFFVAFFMAARNLNGISNVLRWSELSARRRGSLTTLIAMVLAHGACRAREQDSVGSVRAAYREIRGWLFGNISVLYENFESSRRELLIEIAGFDAELDKLQFVDECEFDERAGRFFSLGQCLSLDRSVSEASILLMQTLQSIEDGPIVSENFTDFLEVVILGEGSAFAELDRYRVRLLNTLSGQLTGVLTVLQASAGIIIGVNVALLLATQLAFSTAGQAIDGIRLLLRLLPPGDVAKSPKLMAFLTGVSTSDRLPFVSTVEAVVRQISSAFVSISLGQTIDAVNDAFVQLAKLSVGDVLGQPLVRVIPRPMQERVTELSTIDLTARRRKSGARRLQATASITAFGVSEVGDTGDLYEALDRVMRDGERDVLTLNFRFQSLIVSAAVIPVFDEKGKLESCALLLEDLAMNRVEEIRQRDMKARLDGILVHLHPPHVADSILHAGGQGVRFHADEAIVIALEIADQDRLKEVVPRVLANVLDLLNSVVDDNVQRQTSVHRVRNDGMTLTAVAGLFDTDEEPVAWAEQAACFAENCLRGTREVRERSGVKIELRAGIARGQATGGCAGEMPSFILWGGAVRMAEELAVLATPGEVLVDPGVSELLDAAAWHITGPVKIRGGRGLKPFRISSQTRGDVSSTYGMVTGDPNLSGGALDGGRSERPSDGARAGREPKTGSSRGWRSRNDEDVPAGAELHSFHRTGRVPV